VKKSAERREEGEKKGRKRERVKMKANLVFSFLGVLFTRPRRKKEKEKRKKKGEKKEGKTG